MNKDVLISIKGLQYDINAKTDDDGRVETLNRGTYYEKNDHRYVVYDESIDGEITVKTIIKFNENFLEVTRRGGYSVHLMFEEGKKSYTDYRTPFGNFIIGTDTESIEIEETESRMEVHISYDMEMNYEHLAHCNIDVLIENV